MSGVWGFALICRLRPALAYATVAALTLVLFIALHVVGNRLPYELAAERLAEEFRAAASKEDYGMRGGITWDEQHYCQYSSGVLAGARAARDGGGGLRDAILLRTFQDWSRCPALKAAVLEDVLPDPIYMNVRHWQGGKALYAIALRHLTVRQFHLTIKALIYCGFVALALALVLVGWRALVVGAPLLTFGIFFSAVDQHFNIADGLPFAWALFAAAIGAVLSKRGPMSAARLFLFFAGMVSHFLWLFDGGNFVAATLIGVVVWLAREQDPPEQRVGRAAACVGVYTAGFAVSLALRAVIASSLMEGEQAFAERWVGRAGRLWEQVWAPRPSVLAARDLGVFQEMVRMDAPTFTWLWPTAAAALALAALIASYRAWRRGPAPLLGVLWVCALFLPSVVHFLSPADVPARAPRLMFLPLGLAWCALLVVLTGLPRRQAAAWAGGVGAALVLSYGGTHLASAWQYDSKVARARVLSTTQENGAFAVYLLDAAAGADGAGRRADATPERELIYRKSPCSVQDFRRRFVLHLLAPAASLPNQAPPGLGFVNADFAVYQHGQIFAGTCYASVGLPNYATGIRTGQTIYDGGGSYRNVWMLGSDLPNRAGEAE